MCKHSKTLIAVTLALVMVFSMAVPAFATSSTLYANWGNNPYESKDYPLYFVAPEIDYDFRTVKSAYTDGPIGDLPALYRDGYDFIGWYTEPDGGTKITEDTLFSELNSDGYTILYAHWEQKTNTDPNAVDSATMRDIQARKESLYKYTTKTLNKVPTDLPPTPLPEDLNLDPLDYWEQIIPMFDYDKASVGKTTRPVEEIYQEIRQLVDDLTAGLTTDSDKFAALSSWVDRNITYNNKDNRTENVYLIYEHRYGACMERSYILYFMATLAGIKAAVLLGGTTVAQSDMPIGTNHQSTAAIDENGVWFGDIHNTARGDPVATVAYYNDGQSHYRCDLKTGEITRVRAIKGKNKPIDASTVHFVDVPEDAWYADAVKWAITWGITKGTSENTFSPYKPCTNDEILTFLYRAANDYKFKGRSLHFTPKNDWAVDALEWAYDEDIIPYGYNEADEDAPCTRVTAVCYIWEAFGNPGISSKANFTDMEEYRDYQHEVTWAVQEGIVQGTSPTTFSPGVVCDRATIVTLLYRAYKDELPLNCPKLQASVRIQRAEALFAVGPSRAATSGLGRDVTGKGRRGRLGSAPDHQGDLPSCSGAPGGLSLFRFHLASLQGIAYPPPKYRLRHTRSAAVSLPSRSVSAARAAHADRSRSPPKWRLRQTRSAAVSLPSRSESPTRAMTISS